MRKKKNKNKEKVKKMKKKTILKNEKWKKKKGKGCKYRDTPRAWTPTYVWQLVTIKRDNRFKQVQWGFVFRKISLKSVRNIFFHSSHMCEKYPWVKKMNNVPSKTRHINDIGRRARSDEHFPVTPFHGLLRFFFTYVIMTSVVTYHINAISYLDSQKWVTGSSNDIFGWKSLRKWP